MNTSPKEVAIIGAGLAGCALALSLQANSIAVRIYESRHSTAPELSSGVVLTPNGLHVLDKLGVYDRIKDVCWLGEYRTYKNDRDETTRKILIAGQELYGYANHRLWRRVLLAKMKTLLQEKGVDIAYEHKFEGVIGEDEEEVRFLVNGHEQRAGMLIGADGIYSAVRKHLVDDTIGPEYTGVVGVIAHINRETVQWPYESFEKACTIQGKPGALVIIPEDKDGSEIMVAMQRNHPDQGRAGFEAMAKDKELMANFFRDRYDEWHETGKKILDAVCRHPDSMYLWPYLRVPKLEKWYSRTGRVVLVGDAAHAVPPSSGQGVNQALEDVWTFTALLNSGKDLLPALEFWQRLRQKRIDAVYDWATNATNVQRMPEAERMLIIKARQITDPKVVESFDDMRWLYQPDSEQEIRSWIQGAPVTSLEVDPDM